MKAFELLSEPRSWTQSAYARDAAGEALVFPGLEPQEVTQAPAAAVSKRAVCWDILGAIYRCYPVAERPKMTARIAAHLQGEPPRRSVCEFNDDPRRTHAEVIALLKKLDV